MKKLVVVTVLILAVQSVSAQKFLPKFVRRMLFEKDSSKKSSFFLLPVFSSAPETGIQVGGSALYSFYTDTATHSTRVSNIFGYATVTSKGQSQFSLSTSYWLPKNAFHFTGAISYINFPFDFYGIGNNTLKANVDRLGQKRFKLNIGGEKQVAKHLFAGFVAGGFDYKFTEKTAGGQFETNPAIQNNAGGSSVFIGPSLIFDSRNNNTYTTKGVIITSYFNMMHGILANNGYQGGFLNIEYSQFFLLQKKLVLGIDIQDQNLVGGSSPFYLLPALGSDELMRGYYNGRYRDRNFIAGQTELRFRVNDRLGIVAFAGTGQVFNSSFTFAALKPNFGGGLRYFFDVEKGLSMRLDYGAGQQVPGEARQSGIYLGLGESF